MPREARGQEVVRTCGTTCESAEIGIAAGDSDAVNDARAGGPTNRCRRERGRGGRTTCGSRPSAGSRH